MTNYESMIIISPTLKEDESKKENEKITSFIEKNGGEIEKTDDWGKRRLAYEINKQADGYYFINHFKYDTAKIAELERTYQLNENVIRYNILAN